MSDARASITTDSDGWFKAVSPAFLELIGRPVESLAGVNLIDLVHPLDAVVTRRLLTEAATTPGSSLARIFVAGDIWQPMQLSAADASDDRVTVELAPLATTPVAQPTPTPATTPTPAAPTPTPTPAAPTPTPTPTPAAAAPTPATAADDSPFAPPAAAPEVGTIDAAESFADVATASEKSGPAGAAVPEQRRQVRASMPADELMLEIDNDGRTTFVAGNWHELAPSSESGSAAFEHLLETSGQADVVLDLIAGVMQSGVARQVRVAPHWIQIRPLPSQHRDGVVHALLAVTHERSDGELIDGHVADAATVVRSEVDAPAEPEDNGEAEAEAEPESDLAASEIDDVTAVDGEDPAVEKSGRGFFGWLLLGIAALLLIVIISKLWPSGDDSPSTGPIDIEIANAEPVETEPGQTWRSVGVGSLGEAHGIAATPNGAFIAGINGTIVRLDADGAAQTALSTGGDETSFISDLAADDNGTVWALDAGQGQLYRVTNGDSVTAVATDQNPLRNARGIGISADGMAWIASTAGAQLSKIAPDGATVELISLPGRQPSDVVDVGDGTLWIVDAEKLELAHLRVNGEVLNTLPLEPFTSVHSPHLTIDGDSLWVTEPELSSVFEVDLSSGESTGERIVLVRPGDVRVNKPIGISTDDAGRLWIIDSTGGATIIVE